MLLAPLIQSVATIQTRMAQRKGVDSQASRMAEQTPAAIGGELPLGCEMFCHHTCGGSL